MNTALFYLKTGLTLHDYLHLEDDYTFDMLFIYILCKCTHILRLFFVREVL